MSEVQTYLTLGNRFQAAERNQSSERSDMLRHASVVCSSADCFNWSQYEEQTLQRSVAALYTFKP